MAASTVRFGKGVTSEVGKDCKNLNAKRVLVMTDSNISKLYQLETVLRSLEESKLSFVVYDRVVVEPTEKSFIDAVDFAKQYNPDMFVAVGGGSVIDTCKAANLYFSNPKNEFLDFVNEPIGRALPIPNTLKPLIAIPTTAGTGSETTGVAIFDYTPKNFKTGIASRLLKPTLGLIDPLNTRSMPREVHIASGHALESYTALPYKSRTPRPSDPKYRPAYQGSNPISDIWSLKALEMCVTNLPLVHAHVENFVAQENMILAATFAGIGFGNAGVHLCHGMSYPISGLNSTYSHPGYTGNGVKKFIIPHGIAVAVTSPAVFEWTSSACPERHLDAAKLFGVDVSKVKLEDAGKVLSYALRKFLERLQVPNGISALGYKNSDIGKLVRGTLPQHRVTKLSPCSVEEEALENLFVKSLKIY